MIWFGPERSGDFGMPLSVRARLGDLRGEPASKKLQQVVRQANETPFGVDLVYPTQKKPAEPANFFDLPEHRLHNSLPLGVGGAPFDRS